MERQTEGPQLSLAAMTQKRRCWPRGTTRWADRSTNAGRS